MTSVHGGNYANTTLTPGKTHRLRFANTGINNWVHVSLDKHVFTVIASDFVPIVPYKTTTLAMAVGKLTRLLHSNHTPADRYCSMHRPTV
jgi:FtsP/CotA-like multicopper oxidase with cupredoxin domain